MLARSSCGKASSMRRLPVCPRLTTQSRLPYGPEKTRAACASRLPACRSWTPPSPMQTNVILTGSAVPNADSAFSAPLQITPNVHLVIAWSPVVRDADFRRALGIRLAFTRPIVFSGVSNDTPEAWARATVLKATPVSAAIARLDFWGWAATVSFLRPAASPDFVNARARRAPPSMRGDRRASSLHCLYKRRVFCACDPEQEWQGRALRASRSRELACAIRSARH